MAFFFRFDEIVQFFILLYIPRWLLSKVNLNFYPYKLVEIFICIRDRVIKKSLGRSTRRIKGNVEQVIQLHV